MKNISDELFEKFLIGETSPEDTMLVLEAIKENPELQEKYISVKRYDAIMEAENRDYRFYLPSYGRCNYCR